MTSDGKTSPPTNRSVPDVDVHAEPPRDWDNLLDAAPAAEYSHTAHWMDAGGRHLAGTTPRYLTVRMDGRLVGGLAAAVRQGEGWPRRGRQESSLDGTSGGPVIAGDLPHALQEDVFTALVGAYGAGLRSGLDTCGLDTCALVLAPASETRFGPLMSGLAGWVRHDAPTAAVSLEGGFEHVELHRIGKNKRNERNRGLRRGLEVRITRDPDLLAAYHPLHLAASRVWGTPPTPLEFLQDVLADPGDGAFFSCALLEGRVVGGHLCLHRGDRILAWHGVTDPAVSRSHFPATVLVCTDLEEACRRGVAWLDLGGSGDQGSLAGFKKFFGAELQMRGLYRRETAGMSLLRGTHSFIDRLRGGGRGLRWHDTGEGGR